MTLDVPVSRVFRENLKAIEGNRIIVNEGSSRSTKTYSILQLLIGEALKRPIKITVSRAKLTWLKATVIPDFKSILKDQFGLWNESDYNKTDQIYRLGESEFHFVGLDEAQKLHGRKQDIVWINEAIEAGNADFDQLKMRTTETIILDYNPSTDSHWIYDKVIPRDDCAFIKSTYKDNPFLEPAIVQEIERFEPTPENIKAGTADETNWKIYGLGERAAQKGLIFEHVEYVDKMPELIDCKKSGGGLDFGYSVDPTTLIECRLAHGELWLDQLVYKTGLVNVKNDKMPSQQSIEGELEKLQWPKQKQIVADSAEPKSIREIQSVGFTVVGAVKGPDSVRAGIQTLKQYKINITKRSVDLIKERNNYKWKEDKTGKAKQDPVDAFNHGWDAVRYWASRNLVSKKERQLKVY